MGSPGMQRRGGLEELIRDGEPTDGLDERRSLAAVERGLFGRAKDPVKLGRYVVERRIGSGGVGVVYAAHDPGLDRVVAVKVIDVTAFGIPRSKTHAVLRREARAMARVTHPAVIEVYDVGIAGGLGLGPAFIVMDLVEGTDAKHWLEVAAPSLPQILRVFVDAAEGLAAAHAAGIVHRDFKPSNVLLELHGGTPARVVVSDFGVAWFVREGAPASGATHGTPRYMAPEQHEGRTPDARSDQHGFCVALWEAAVGQPPFGARRAMELIEAKLSGAPPRPRALPRWLFAILRRGLDPDPARRFPDLARLVAALRNGRSWSRRTRRASVAGAVALLGAGAVLVSGASAETQRCTAGAQEFAAVYDAERGGGIRAALDATGAAHADDTASRALHRLEAHGHAWVTERNEACAATSLRDELPPNVLDRRMACLDQNLREVESVVSALERADPRTVDRAVALVAGITDVTSCADIERLMDASQGDPRDTAERAELEAELAEGRVTYRLGRYADAREAALRVADKADGRGFAGVQARALLAATAAAAAASDPMAAEELGTRAYVTAVAAGDSRTAARAAVTLTGVVGNMHSRYADAQAWSEHARTRIERLGGAPQLEAGLLAAKGRLAAQAELPGAVDLLREALRVAEATPDLDPRRVAKAHWDLGYALMLASEVPEAKPHYEQALQILELELGPEHPKVGQARANVGSALLYLGEHDAAERSLLRARETARRTGGERTQGFVDAETSLATLAARRGEDEDAIGRLRGLVEIAPSVRGPDHPMLATLLASLAVALASVGDVEDAAATLERALVHSERLPAGHGLRRHLLLAHAEVLVRAGRSTDARARALEGLDGLGRTIGPIAVRGALVLGEIDLAEGDAEGASARVDPLVQSDAIDPVHRADAMALLARALWDSDRARARRLASRALNAFAQQGARPKAARLQAWADERGS